MHHLEAQYTKKASRKEGFLVGGESDKVVELGAAADRLGGQSLHSVLIAQQTPPSLSARCGV